MPVSSVGGGEVVVVEEVVGGGEVVVVEEVVGGGEVVVVEEVVGGGEVVVAEEVVDDGVVVDDVVVIGGDEVGVVEEQEAARIATDIAATKAATVALLVISRITRGGVQLIWN